MKKRSVLIGLFLSIVALDGVAAAIYGACEVKVKVENGTEITIKV
ncbi:hypothetical protein FACS189421_08100 [Bacteroidia bacterium]|nr:hypothetical protein FACS189421_08100 [Bacteroidia bacterium]GHT03856.1 hypothetical protein FACS189423_05650 [Bacteroidia bacterium]GHT49852.1 hypothetical protein FACS189440_16270 [Bacteroidia bacterium]